MKTIVIACGAGVASSAIMKAAVEALLRRRGIEARIVLCRYSQLEGYAGQAALIVSSMAPPRPWDVPVVPGLPFLTGQGLEGAEGEIVRLLGEKVHQQGERP